MAFARRTARRINEFNNVRWRGDRFRLFATQFRGHKVLIERTIATSKSPSTYITRIDGGWYNTAGGSTPNQAKFRALLTVVNLSPLWTAIANFVK